MMSNPVIDTLCVPYSDEELETLFSVEKNQSSKPKAPKKQRTSAMFRLLQVRDKIAIFEGISNSDLQHMISEVHFKTFNRGQTLIQEGDKSRHIFLILAGECEVNTQGRNVGSVQGGNLFGEIGAIFHQERTATVRVSSEEVTVLIFKIALEKTQEFPNAFLQLYRSIADQLSQKLHQANKV
jgi:CRP-like cAMP-binding protein